MKTPRQCIKLEEPQRQLLGEWVRAHGTPQQVAKRCQIILQSADGKSDKAIAKELDINRHTCRLWRERFAGCGVDCLWEVEAGRGRKSQAGLAQSIIEAPRTKSKLHAIHMTDALPSSIELSPVQRDMAAPIIDKATNLSVAVDAITIKSLRRVKSDVFEVALPEENVFDPLCGGPGTVPGGIYSPAVDDGFYVLLNPLPVGSHTLHIHAESTVGPILQDVTYNLTVVRVLRK